MNFYWCNTCNDRFASDRPECPDGKEHREAVIDYDEHFLQQIAGMLRMHDERQMEKIQQAQREIVAKVTKLVQEQSEREKQWAEQSTAGRIQ